MKEFQIRKKTTNIGNHSWQEKNRSILTKVSSLYHNQDSFLQRYTQLMVFTINQIQSFPVRVNIKNGLILLWNKRQHIITWHLSLTTLRIISRQLKRRRRHQLPGYISVFIKSCCRKNLSSQYLFISCRLLSNTESFLLGGFKPINCSYKKHRTLHLPPRVHHHCWVRYKIPD